MGGEGRIEWGSSASIQSNEYVTADGIAYAVVDGCLRRRRGRLGTGWDTDWLAQPAPGRPVCVHGGVVGACQECRDESGMPQGEAA
jgi:hypothetical protein